MSGLLAAASANADHLQGVSASDLYQTAPAELKRIAPDLYFFHNDATVNSAFLVTPQGVLVVDTTEHPADARALMARIRAVTDRPVRWAINTHAHGDHYLGNSAFKDAGATIVAHRDTAAMMRAHYDYELSRRADVFKRRKLDTKELRLVLPDVTFDRSMAIELGGRTVNVGYLGPGQNPGDTLVYFPHARAVYVGGPFARRNISNLSFTPSVEGWMALLSKIADLDVDVYLPGHGGPGTRADLLDEVKLLADLQSGVRASVARNQSPDDMLKELTFREYKGLRNYDRLHAQLLALRQLIITGKPVIALP